MKEEIERINKNSKKMIYLNYDNWGIKVSNLLIVIASMFLLAIASIISSLIFSALLIKESKALFSGLFVLSMILLLISILVIKKSWTTLNELWFNFYQQVIHREGQTVDQLTQEAFSRYVISLIINKDYAQPSFGYETNPEGVAASIAFANITYESDDYIPMISCLYAIVDSENGKIRHAGGTRDLNRSARTRELAENETLVVLSHGVANDDSLRNIIRSFQIEYDKE